MVSELGKINNKLSQSTVHGSQFTQIIKQILIPEIEKQVNNGPAFANLRQIYNAVILATWYKKNLKQSLLGQVYIDRGKTEGVSHHDPKAKEAIYNQYLEAFKKGADAIKEEYNPATQEVITRKYISGGMDLAQLGEMVKKTGAEGLARELTGAQQIAIRLDAAMKASPHDPYISEELEKNLPFRIDRPIFTGQHTAAFAELTKAYRDLVSQQEPSEQHRNTFKPFLQRIFSLSGMTVSSEDLDEYIMWLQLKIDPDQEALKKIKVINEHLLQESKKNGFIFMPRLTDTDRNGKLYSTRSLYLAGPIVEINYAPGVSKSGKRTDIFNFSVWPFLFSDVNAEYLNEFVSKDNTLFSTIPYRLQTPDGPIKINEYEKQMVQFAKINLLFSNQLHHIWSAHEIGHTLTAKAVREGDATASRFEVRDDIGTYRVDGLTGLQRFNLYKRAIFVNYYIEEGDKKLLSEILSTREERYNQFLIWESSALGYGFYSQLKNGQNKVETFQMNLRLIRDTREGIWLNIVPRIFWVVSMLDEISQAQGLDSLDREEISNYKVDALSIEDWKSAIQRMLDSEALKEILQKVDLDQINQRVYKQITGFDLNQFPTVFTPEESLQAWMKYVAKQDWGRKVKLTDAAMRAEGYANKAAVLEKGPGQIRAILEAQGILEPEDITLMMNLIENHRKTYESLGLANYNYHDFVHSLIVTQVMILNLQADQKATVRDWKVGFVAALLHDFHIRDKDKDNTKQGTIAYVPETIRQIKRLLNIANGDALPQEYLFEIFLKDPVQGPVLQQLAGNIRSLLGEDFDGMMHEVLALILRTHNAYNVAPAPVEYLKKGKAIRARFETKINAGDIKMTDIEKYVKREYKNMLAEVNAENEMSTNEKNIAKTWLEQQQIVELAYLKESNQVEKSRRIENNRWANILEKVADKGGNYLIDSPEMIENEIIPGLNGEVPVITLKGNYKGFIKNELLNEEVLQFISRLPVETKRLFMHNVGHFAAIDGELEEWDTQLSLQVEKILFPNGDAAQMATPIIEEVLARKLEDPIDQGRVVGKMLGLPENLIPPGIRFIKAGWGEPSGTENAENELVRVVSYRLKEGGTLNEINVYYGDKMRVITLIHELGHYMNLFLNNGVLVDFMNMAIEQILEADPETLPFGYMSETYQRALQYLSSIKTGPGKIFENDGNIELRQDALNLISDEWARGLGYYLGHLAPYNNDPSALKRFKVYQEHYRSLGIVQPDGSESGININPDTEEFIRIQKERESRRSSPPTNNPDVAAAVKAPGGIDLNPDKIRFDRQGQPVDFNVPSNDALIQDYLNIEGFEPIIINITPITNIPLLLGTAEPGPANQTLTKI